MTAAEPTPQAVVLRMEYDPARGRFICHVRFRDPLLPKAEMDAELQRIIDTATGLFGGSFRMEELA